MRLAARLLFGRIEEGATSGVAVAGWERGEGAALPLVLGDLFGLIVGPLLVAACLLLGWVLVGLVAVRRGLVLLLPSGWSMDGWLAVLDSALRR